MTSKRKERSEGFDENCFSDYYSRYSRDRWLNMAALIKEWSEIWSREAENERLQGPPHDVRDPSCWLLDSDITGPWREKCAQWQSTYSMNSPELMEINGRQEYLRNQGVFRFLYRTIDMDYEL